MSNSLDRTVNIYYKPHTTNMIEYFVKIVPTTYMDMRYVAMTVIG